MSPLRVIVWLSVIVPSARCGCPSAAGDVPKSTTESDASSVVQVMTADVAVGTSATMPRTGGVVSMVQP